jgi:hypothetical protein
MTSLPGLTFSEAMSGRFSLGEQEPDIAAAAAGRDDVLLLRATLTVPDVAGFVQDPEHRGGLDGSITFDPLGEVLPARGGWFKLFARSGDPEVKLMVYRMTVARGTTVYTLHGEKRVRRGSVLRAWPETTTLRCRLHAGEDDTAAVCGAGILRISGSGFARQLLSFRTLRARTPAAKARALAVFFGFFARELAESYLPARRTRREELT